MEKVAVPSDLSAEFTGVWTGWNSLKNREVAREAATKGSHISLAHKFIAARNNCELVDAEQWFNTEVRAWARQLLMQRQVFKATHVLSNINLDPYTEFSGILTESQDSELRDYVAGHLSKTKKIDNVVWNHWKLLKAIESADDLTIYTKHDDFQNLSISKLIDFDSNFKEKIAAELFIQIFDFSLTPFLNAENVWFALLIHDKLALLYDWIHIYFNKNCRDFEIKSKDTDSMLLLKMSELFLIWEITPDMVNSVEAAKTNNFTKDFVLNELSIYGIFTDQDKKSILRILKRIANVKKLIDLDAINDKTELQVNNKDFNYTVAEFYLENKLFNQFATHFKDNIFNDHVKDQLNSRELNLFLTIREMFNDLNNNDKIRKCILETCQYFCNRNEDTYFIQNPLIFLSLILFNDNLKIENVFEQSQLQIEDITINEEVLSNIKKNLSMLSSFFDKKKSDKFKQDINVYQLLANYKNIDMTQVFHFRFKHDANRDLLPRFDSEQFIQRYGHKENVNFTLYLKQGRPSIAYKLFIMHQFKKYGKITKKSKQTVNNSVCKFACDNFKNREIVAASVAFTEMLGMSSETLRLYLNTMSIILKNNQNENIYTLFENFSFNSKKILELLENSLMKETTNENLNSYKTVSYLADWEIAIKFAMHHKLDYPEAFLEHCASNSLWMPFLIFVQYHNYPTEQVMNSVLKFENKSIAEHLNHALSNDLKPTSLSVEERIKSRDSRKTLYSKIGGNLSQSEGSPSEGSSYKSDELEINYFNADLITVLINCHKTINPSEALLSASKLYMNPIFAVFATFYEPKSTVVCWLTWLATSIRTNEFWDLLCHRNVTPETVTKLLEVVAANRQFSVLADSFQIFLPENPLCSLTTFLSQYIKDLQLEHCHKYLKTFKTAVTYMLYSSSPSEYDLETKCLTDRKWIMETTVKLAHYALAYGFKSTYRQEMFLNLLCDENFISDLKIDDLYFHHLKNLMLFLCETDVRLDFEAVLELSNAKRTKNEEFQRCINELISKHKFDKAFSLALFENINADNILIEKWKFKFQTRDSNVSTFWTSCEKSLRNQKVEPVTAAMFFIHVGDSIMDNLEKYIVLKFAFGWLKECTISNTEIQKVELEMWWLYLNIDDWKNFTVDFDEGPSVKSPLSDLIRKANISSIIVTRLLETQQQKQRFEELIGMLLDKGQIVQAIRLEHIFNYKTKNLSLIKTCMQLAEGELNPYQLSPEHRVLVNKTLNRIGIKSRHRTLSSVRLLNDSGSSSSGTSPNLNKEYNELHAVNSLDIESALVSLTQHITRGTAIAGRILCCSRIAMTTSRSYATILTKYEAANLLKSVFNSNCVNKLEMANDIMIAHSWNRHRIAEFLCAELVSAISKYALQDSVPKEPICLWGYQLDTNMHLVLELCTDPSLLGNALLTHTTAPLTSTSKNTLCLAGELLIRSHDCFTADCNMEGISLVLQRAQALVASYNRLQAWAPMVRLLTGIGRYAEMVYVFQIIQENDQFESLLGHAPAVGLKRATMDYLARYCPGQRELSRMVALRWGLYDFAAELWESEAQDIVTNLVKVAKLEMQNAGKNPGPTDLIYLNTTDGANRKVLDNAMNCFAHAVEHYLLANRLSSANRATRSAELVALQLGLLANASESTSVCVFELSSQQLNNLILNHLDFIEARILISVYNHPSDWGAILYEQCVVKNKFEKYLPAFLAAFPLSDSLAKDVVRRYLIYNKPARSVPKSLMAILDVVKSPSTKYRLASELGLRDMVYNLLEGPAKAYLQDTVWTTGCPPPD